MTRKKIETPEKLYTFTASMILVMIIGYLLIAGRSLLVPLVIAIFLWYLLNTIYSAVEKIPFGIQVPKWLRKGLSLLIVVLFIKVIIDILKNNINDVIEAAPRYQENLTHILNTLDHRFHIKAFANIDNLLQSISVQKILLNTYDVFTSITSSAFLIMFYIIFLFIEQHFFKTKLNALFPHESHRNLVRNISNHIVKDTQTYLGLKILLGLIAAFASWLIMVFVHLDFAAFWALLIFFLNFIPNIGPIIATAFPMLLAIIQFDNWVPFTIVASGIIGVQFIIGNFVEPRFLGKSLNLSPLVILMALALWGSIWGVLGMFLSVPITVMLMIIFAHFEATRPIAILLSQDGQIKSAYETLES